MARNGENLFRRTGERYWRFKYKTIDGKYREQSTGKELKSEGRLIRDEHLARYRAGQTPNDMKTWPLSRAVEERLSMRKIQRPKSYRIERTCLRAVMRVFGSDKRLGSITNIDLERYQVARLKMKKERGMGPLRPATVNLEILYLAQLLKRAKLWSRLEEDYQPLPESKSGIGRAITLDQFTGLLKVALSHPEWEVAFCATVISACAGGLRSIEIRNLRLENCRLSGDGAWLTIPREATKTDAGCREIPLNGPGRWALERLLQRAELAGARDPRHFLLPKDRSKHTRPDDPRKGERGYDPTDHQSSWRTAWHSLCAEAGLPTLRFHDLRHLFITQAAEADVPLLVTESLVGHMSTDMIRHYTHIRDAAKQKAVEAIEREQSSVMDILRAFEAPAAAVQ